MKIITIVIILLAHTITPYTNKPPKKRIITLSASLLSKQLTTTLAFGLPHILIAATLDINGNYTYISHQTNHYCTASLTCYNATTTGPNSKAPNSYYEQVKVGNFTLYNTLLIEANNGFNKSTMGLGKYRLFINDTNILTKMIDDNIIASPIVGINVDNDLSQVTFGGINMKMFRFYSMIWITSASPYEWVALIDAIEMGDKIFASREVLISTTSNNITLPSKDYDSLMDEIRKCTYYCNEEFGYCYMSDYNSLPLLYITIKGKKIKVPISYYMTVLSSTLKKCYRKGIKFLCSYDFNVSLTFKRGSRWVFGTDILKKFYIGLNYKDNMIGLAPRKEPLFAKTQTLDTVIVVVCVLIGVGVLVVAFIFIEKYCIKCRVKNL